VTVDSFWTVEPIWGQIFGNVGFSARMCPVFGQLYAIQANVVKTFVWTYFLADIDSL